MNLDDSVVELEDRLVQQEDRLVDATARLYAAQKELTALRASQKSSQVAPSTSHGVGALHADPGVVRAFKTLFPNPV